jgi:thiosulfate reductase cytochrome b subunit
LGDEKVTGVGKKIRNANYAFWFYAGMIISFQSFSETAAIVKLFCGWLFLSFCLTFTDGQTQQRKYERNTHSRETFKNKYRNIERRK